jgi:hypothetical protein
MIFGPLIAGIENAHATIETARSVATDHQSSPNEG